MYLMYLKYVLYVNLYDVFITLYSLAARTVYFITPLNLLHRSEDQKEKCP